MTVPTLRLALFLAVAIATAGSTVLAQSHFRRGDAGGDGVVDMDDVTLMQDVLFGTATLACQDAADTNDDGSFNTFDVIFLASYLFTPGSPPPSLPGPLNCGDDPTVDPLSCLSYSCSFLRGDADIDGFVTVADVAAINSHLFMGSGLKCLDSGDVNDDGTISTADSILLASLLMSGASPPLPGPTVCGSDYTADSLDCQQYVCKGLFRRGDADGDGDVDNDDATAVTNFLFLGTSLNCLDAADANDDGGIDNLDALAILGYVAGTTALPAPGPDICGPDPTPDVLGCGDYTCAFIRGDVNDDGTVDLNDPAMLQDFLFLAGPTPPCLDAADADDDGTLTNVDAIFLLNMLVVCTTLPPDPVPGVPGVDPTVDSLSCDDYTLRVPVDFQRGDCNIDSGFDIGDPITLLSILFPPAGVAVPPACQDACDANDDGCLNIADVITMLSAAFAPGLPLPPPYGVCGYDPTPLDGIGCRSYLEAGCP